LPIPLFYGEKDLNMTTLKPVSLSAMEIGSVDNSFGGNDIASQITRLTKQITKVTQQLKEVAMGDATAEEKQKQQNYSHLSWLCCRHSWRNCQRQQAEEAMPKPGKRSGSRGRHQSSPPRSIRLIVYI
jgi:hypothetical protein